MTDKKQTEAVPEDARHAIPGDEEQSIYRFITVAAKRARQLQSGHRPKVMTQSRKVTRVAMEETRRGLVEHVDPEKAPPPEPPAEEEETIDQ